MSRPRERCRHRVSLAREAWHYWNEAVMVAVHDDNKNA